MAKLSQANQPRRAKPEFRSDRRTPRTVLYELAITGPAAVRIEAIRLMELPSLPERWPPCAQYSPQAARRRLALTKGKAAKLRLQALKELLWPVTDEQRAAVEELRGATHQRPNEADQEKP